VGDLSSSRASDEPCEDLTEYGWLIVSAVLLGLLLLSLLWLVAQGVAWLAVIWFLILGPLFVRYTTLRVKVCRDGVFVRQLPTINRTIDWTELESASVVSARGAMNNGYCLGLRLASGKLIICRAVAGYGETNTSVRAAAALVNAQIENPPTDRTRRT